MEETDLIRACLHGHAGEFQGIVERYEGAAMALAANILGNREDAQDVCQETFIQAFRNLDRFDLGSRFKPWLFTILYRKCLDELRKKRRSREAFVRMWNETDAKSNPSANANPSPERPSLSQKILGLLSPKERTAVCLWADEGYTAVEISQVLRCSSSTARVHLFKARKKIKAMMENKNVQL